MCLKVVVHYTACDFRRKVHLKYDPRLPLDGAPFPDYNIYYPFEAPGRCDHYIAPEDMIPGLGDVCSQHGTCCTSFVRYMCDQSVHRGHFNCMGHTLVAHLIRNLEVTADQPTWPSLRISSQLGPSLPVANKSVLFKALDDYLQVGIEIHHALNNYYETIPGEPQEGESFETAQPDLVARWKSARREWSRGSLNYLSSSEPQLSDCDHTELARWAFAPYWMEEFRIPKVRYVPEYLPYDEDYFKDSWEYDSESNSPSQSDASGNVRNNDGISYEHENNENSPNDISQGSEDYNDQGQDDGSYQDAAQGNGNEDGEDPGWHGGYGGYLSMDDPDEDSEDSSSDENESHDSNDHHSATSNSNSNRPTSEVQLLQGPSSNEPPSSDLGSSDWASQSDSVESLPSPSLPQPAQSGPNNTPAYIFYNLPDPEFDNRVSEPYGHIDDLRIDSGSPEELDADDFSSDGDYDDRSGTRWPSFGQVIESEPEYESESEKNESTETSLEEYNPEDWGESEIEQEPATLHMNFDLATSAADVAVATGHSWPVQALASSAIEYLDLWAQDRNNDSQYTGGLAFPQHEPEDANQPFESEGQPYEPINEEEYGRQDQEPSREQNKDSSNHGVPEPVSDNGGNSGAEGADAHEDRDESSDSNEPQHSSSSSGADADIDSSDSADSHGSHETDSANPEVDPGGNVGNQPGAGDSPSSNHTDDTNADNTNNSSSNNEPRQDSGTPLMGLRIPSVDTQRMSNWRDGFVDGPPPGRSGADRWIISEREVAAAVAEQAGRSAEYSSDDPRNPEYGNGNSNHTGDTNSFNHDSGPSASLRNHGGWSDNNPFVNGNGVVAPVANGANWQIQARAQGMGSESNIDEDSDELPSTADPASPRWEQVDLDNDENVPANPGHNVDHPLQPPPNPLEPDNGQPPMSPFILRPLGLPRELYTPPPLPPWSPLILPRPFTGDNAPFPQRRGSVHGGFAVPNANQWTYSDDSDSEFGMADYFTGQVEFGPVNWNSASISGARNEMALSPLSRSFRDIAGRRREFQPDFRANILFESLYPAHVGGNESEDLPDYESPDEPSRPTTSGVPVMPQEDYNDPDNLPDYESSEELAPQTSYHNGVVERNGRFESEDLSGYESDEDSPPTQQPWSSRRPERFASRASAAASAARALLPGEQAAQDEGPNGAAAGDTDSSDFGSISDSSSRSSSEDDEGDNSTDDDDSQEPPAPPVPTGGSSESGDDGGCAPSRYPDSPPPSPGGCGGTIPVAAENDHGRTQTWIDVYGEAVTAFEGADFAEARGNKRKSSELGDEDTAPGVPQAGKRRRLTDEPGSSALSTPSPPAEVPSNPALRASGENISSQDLAEDQVVHSGSRAAAASSESSSTKRKVGEVEDDDQEEEVSHSDDDEPLSPIPREWTLRRLSTELRGMGSRIVTKRRRFY